MKTKFQVSIMADEGQSCKDQSSAQIVATIDDLLKQILLRLPIKSLIRFKSISKHWNSIITDPHFCFQRSPNPNPPVGLVLSYPDVRDSPKYEYVPFSGIESTSPSFVSDPRKMSIAHSCNGLLLCYRCRLPQDYEYYVCNPTTNQISPLPKPYQRCRWSKMSLVFDPTKSPYYKVVCADNLSIRYGMRPRHKHKYQFLVYSSESRVWNKCGKPFKINGMFENGVCWNGAIHWIKSHISGGFKYLNLEDQIIREMPTPPLSYFKWGTCLRESCDRLHYINEKSPEPERVLIVYEMKRDYSEWFINYIVDVSLLEAAYPGMVPIGSNPLYAYYTYSLIWGDKDENSFMILKTEGKLIRYNIVDKTFETIYNSAKVRGSWRCFDLGFQHIESLWCV